MALYTRLLPLAFRIPAIIRDYRIYDLPSQSTRKSQECRYSVLLDPLVIQRNQAASNLLEENKNSDSSFLEEDTEEYIDHSKPISTPSIASIADDDQVKSQHHFGEWQAIVKHIKAKDWERAERLRNECIEHDLHIKRHPIFVEAAIQAWQSSPPEHKIPALYEWLRLIPPASSKHIREMRSRLKTLKRSVMSEAPADLDTLACIALVAARKGYANFLSLDILMHITRYSAPSSSLAFFKVIEREAFSYLDRFGEEADLESAVLKRMEFHNMYLRALLLSGYCQEAVKYLHYMVTKARTIEVQPFTWNIMLEELESLGLTELHQEAAQLCSEFGPPEGLPQTQNRPTPPSARELSQTIASLLDSGDMQGLELLKQDITQTKRQMDLWSGAEMKFYQNRNEHALVLKVFLKNFLCIGVPKDVLVSYSQMGGDPTLNPWLQTDVRHMPGIDTGRWPTTHIVSMVWGSLVKLASFIQEVDFLYRTFLGCWKTFNGTLLPVPFEENPSLVSLHFQHPPVTCPDAVMFHPFLVGFRRCGEVTRILDVLSDMTERGIRPSAHNWTVVAGLYVWDNPLAVQKILDRMESNTEEYDELTDRVRTRLGPIQRPSDWMPPPIVATYTDILRGLIESRRLQEAKRLITHVQQRGFFPEKNEHWNLAVQILGERLERKPWQARLMHS